MWLDGFMPVLLNHGGNTSGEIATLRLIRHGRASRSGSRTTEDYGYDGLLEGYRPTARASSHADE